MSIKDHHDIRKMKAEIEKLNEELASLINKRSEAQRYNNQTADAKFEAREKEIFQRIADLKCAIADEILFNDETIFNTAAYMVEAFYDSYERKLRQ